MAAYAAVLSLFHTLNHIKQHPCPPISVDQSQVDSLTQNITFFQGFLERYPNQEDDDLESRIAAAAYAVEDVIETHIVDQIHARSNITTVDFSRGRLKLMDAIKKKVKKIVGINIRGDDLHQDLEGVMGDMDLIKREVMEIIPEKIMGAQHHPHLHSNSSVSTASWGPAPTWRGSTMPTSDNAMGMVDQVLDKLTGQQSGLQIISIVGMGGIGKTTFARNIYTNPLILQHFDTLAWVTISQEYSRGNILQVLCQEVKGNINGLSEMSEEEIGLILYKYLWGRRYLIVMDDIWSIEAWNKVKSFFPDNNESRVMITTRQTNVALELSGCHVLKIPFLNENNSWVLLQNIVFGELSCPFKLIDIGKEIANKSRGLPLSIIVIGGLLKKSDMTEAYWIYTLENLNLLINLEDNEYTLRILRTSYTELPMHLRLCFLYMGVFPEDFKINVSKLIKLWVTEGILRPIDGKSLEDVGREYMMELIDRNLIVISKLRWNGEAKLCKMHDLLRDVCLKEAQKQKLFCVVKQQKHHTPKGIDMERRICIDPENANEEYSPKFLHAVESASLTRSLLYKAHVLNYCKEASPSLRFRLLRVHSAIDENNSIVTRKCDNAIFKQVNLRFLSLKFNYWDAAPSLHSLCSLLWNLQTLKVVGLVSRVPMIAHEIWEMPLLRHVRFYRFAIPDPPNREHSFVLEHLQTLSGVTNLKFSEAVVKRIPNIKKLKVIYESCEFDEDERSTDYFLENLGRLQKLESLNFELAFHRNSDLENIWRSFFIFPHSLKKLILCGTMINWDDLMTVIGPLPLLQLLKLNLDAGVGPRWETFEGQFCSLKFLEIMSCVDLEYWETDSAHFPRLEILRLHSLKKLVEIPSSIGDISTLRLIQLKHCCMSAYHSAEKIKEEQEENGNEDLQFEFVF